MCNNNKLRKLLKEVPPEARPYLLRAFHHIVRLTAQLRRARLRPR